MDVRLPDGRVITNVPEGTTKSMLMAKIGKLDAGQNTTSSDSIPLLPPLKDLPNELGKSFAQSGASLASGVFGGLSDVGRLVTDPVVGLLDGDVPQDTDTNRIRNWIDEKTDGYTKPRNSTERVIGKTTEILGGLAAPLGAEAQISKLASKAPQLINAGNTFGRSVDAAKTLVPQTAKEAASFAGSAAGSAIGQEIAPDNGFAQIAGGLLGGVAPYSKDIIQYGVKSAGRGILNGLTNPAENALPEVAAAAAKEGIQLPASALTQSPVVRSTEARLAQSGFSGNTYSNLTKQVDDDMLRIYSESLDGLSSKRIDPARAGETLQTAVGDAFKKSKADQTVKYNTARQFMTADPVDITNTSTSTQSALEKLNKSRLLSPDQKSVIKTIDDLNTSLTSKPATIEELVATKVSLNDMINYDDNLSTTFKNFLKPIVRGLNDDIAEYGTKNPEFYGAYQEAESLTAEKGKLFGNKLLKKIINNETPEAVLNAIVTPSDVGKIEDALGGQRYKGLLDSVKRAKVEEMLNAKIMKEGASGPSFSEANFMTAMSKDDSRSRLVKRLLPKESVERLENLTKIAQGVVEGKQFYNPSRSGAAVIDASLGTLTGILTLSGNPFGGAAVAASPYVLSRIMTNPKTIDMITTYTKATKNGDAEGARRASQALLPIIQSLTTSNGEQQ